MTGPPAPTVGSRWRHPAQRHPWKVAVAGRVYVTLRSEFPGGGDTRVPVEQWPRDFDGRDWQPA